MARLPNFQKILGAEKVVIAHNLSDLEKKIRALQPDILHVHYSGVNEPPLSIPGLVQSIPSVVTTNVFAHQNYSPDQALIKKIFFVSEWLWKKRALWAKDDVRAQVLFNPIEKPLSSENLRAKLNIPAHAFVIGRIGRPDPDIHDPISLNAYAQIEAENTYFLALAPPPNMQAQAKALGLKHFVALPVTVSAEEVSRFYNSIDVLAHARRDGETFGCNIAEAMIHGKPVVSHLSGVDDAQVEVIGDTGYVVPQGDVAGYAFHLKALYENQDVRLKLSAMARARAENLFEASSVTRKLESIYDSLTSVAEKNNDSIA